MISTDYFISAPSTADVTNPPTDAELDSEFGAPATVGAGFSAYIDDNGAGTNFYQVVSDGTNWWNIGVGSYGEINVEGNSTATTISGADTAFGANAVQVTIFDTNGTSNGTTPDHTNDHITINQAGVYKVEANIHFSGAASADTFSFALFKNNKDTQLGARGTRKLSGGGDVGSASISAVVALAATDTVELWIQNESNANDPTVQDACLSVFSAGLTTKAT